MPGLGAGGRGELFVHIHTDEGVEGLGIGQSSPGVREVVEAGGTAWALGMNRDQNDVAPEVILGSALIRIPEAFLETAEAWRSGTLGGRPLYAGSVDDVVDFLFNPGLVGRVPDSLRAAVDAARARIRAGELQVPRVDYVEGEPGVP